MDETTILKLEFRFIELYESVKQFQNDFSVYAHIQREKLKVFEEVMSILGLDFSYFED